jgi:hypothetical protein
MSFPPNVKLKALLACGRRCCLCNEFKGIKIECHHIVQETEGGENSFENCIPLCFDCHADMRSFDHKHPKGTKYTANELRRHRDKWYAQIASGSAPSYQFDQIAAEPVPDVRLWDALWRAFLKTWDPPKHEKSMVAEEPWPGYWDEFLLFSGTEVRQAALDSKLPIWGRRAGNWFLEQTAPPLLERISSEFWRNNWIDEVDFLHHDPDKLTTKALPPNEEKEKWRDLRTQRAAIECLWPPLNQGPLRIEVGETGEFFETGRASNIYTHTRILKLRISNSESSRSLSGCKIHVLSILPHEYDGPWLLKDGFTIAAGDHEFVPLVSFTEARNPQISPYGDTFVEILSTKNRPKPSSSETHVLTLRATTLDGPFCEMRCKLWVENGRLRIESIVE